MPVLPLNNFTNQIVQEPCNITIFTHYWAKMHLPQYTKPHYTLFRLVTNGHSLSEQSRRPHVQIYSKELYGLRLTALRTLPVGAQIHVSAWGCILAFLSRIGQFWTLRGLCQGRNFLLQIENKYWMQKLSFISSGIKSAMTYF